MSSQSREETTLEGALLRFAGLATSPGAFLLAEAHKKRNTPTLIVVSNTSTAERLASDLSFFAGKDNIGNFFPWEVLPFDGLSPSAATSAGRLHALYLLLNGNPIIIAPAVSLMQKIMAPEMLKEGALSVQVGMEFDRDDLARGLAAGGYVRSSLVEESGQMALRGSVVDVFPPGTRYPLRIEYFGQEIESLRYFDPAKQRSLSSLEEFEILPSREIVLGEDGLKHSAGHESVGFTERAIVGLKERASELDLPQSVVQPYESALRDGVYWPGLEQLLPIFSSRVATLWEYLSDETEVAVWDEESVLVEAEAFDALLHERAERAKKEGRLFPDPGSAYLSYEEFASQLMESCRKFFDPSTILSDRVDSAKHTAQQRIHSNNELHTNLLAAHRREEPFKPLANYLRGCLDKRMHVAISVGRANRRERMHELLSHYHIEAIDHQGSFAEWKQEIEQRPEPRVWILEGVLSSGFQSLDGFFAVVSDRELFPETRQRVGAGAAKQVRKFLGALSQLTEGDFVVHMDYGIGRYTGFRQLGVEGKIGDFLELEYAEKSKLFLPVEQLGKLQKYAGADRRDPKLTKLGGKTWEKTKAKVRKQVAELAGQLLSTMAQRELAEGTEFGEFDSADQQFADRFEFEETPDQANAIADVLDDMAKSRPMDRLVCGDVGYGKTEVALRAAFKAASNGKQVAVLVPTTVLVEQHYKSFLERFEDTALVIGCVSRFFTPAENKETLQRVKAGKIDILVGTHRLLQKDVFFKDLGLVVIDEEHRFGVAHKEKLKRFRSTVDVLTLTATPIPRTLHMSLVGIRDLSVIETAPANRQVIRTFLAQYDEGIVREAIMRELGRGGQVFYIHNRVETIAAAAAHVSNIVPEARLAFAHGQMKPKELETIMHRFISGEVDVLVSTTIVESGLDISNANTIIIRKAEHFGLAELYQLRGRVGRSDRRAYAYLLISDPTRIGKNARKRLEVLQSLDDLGVGFRLALQDMEIRGAGNLLGKDQSGNINQIGYELYSRILKDAVEQLRRQQESEGSADLLEPAIDPEIKIGFPAHIPPVYIPDVAERLLLYQRLIEVSHEREIAELAAEVNDRFGSMPEEVEILLEAMEIRVLLTRNKIVALKLLESELEIQFHERAEIDSGVILRLLEDSPDNFRLMPSGGVRIQIGCKEFERPSEAYSIVKTFLDDLNAAQDVLCTISI